ncbi:hypothetical protein L6V77_11075 [Myxococcota bacterium]|nr:hypothetical protein [Myxococcota bacterium]
MNSSRLRTPDAARAREVIEVLTGHAHQATGLRKDARAQRQRAFSERSAADHDRDELDVGECARTEAHEAFPRPVVESEVCDASEGACHI